MESSREKKLFSGVVYLSLILSALICASINGMTLSAALVRICYAVVLGAVFLAVLHRKEDFVWNQIDGKTCYLITFALSVCLTGVASRYSVGMYWMLVLVVAGCMKDAEIKIVTYGILLAVYTTQALAVHKEIAQLEYYLIMGIAISLVLSVIKQRQEIPYAGVILTALSLALLVLRSGFDFEVLWQQKYDVILEISSLVFLILFGTLLRMTREVSWAVIRSQDELETVIMGLLQDDFVLMQQLKKNDDLYHHSYEISRVSGLAASAAGCDSMLASAGGMYHEIGRLLSQTDYMEASMKLADKYGFPERLKDVIRQHNTGSEVPKSPEAAIVMLSDCIVSTGEYLERSGKRAAISDEKLVKSIFSNRKAKGSLDESGLTEKQLNDLMEFYISNTFVK